MRFCSYGIMSWIIYCLFFLYNSNIVFNFQRKTLKSNIVRFSSFMKMNIPEVHMKDPIADEIFEWNNNEMFIQSFLNKYWQKKPLLIRNSFLKNHLNATKFFELMKELASDDDVESRLILKRGKRWRKDYGPFEKTDFDDLPNGNWTLLINEVDRHNIDIAKLWDYYFDFIPNWRRDDIMMSYASKGGGIGAHIDNYDVFLVQGGGSREWSIENRFITVEEEKFREVPNADTRLLQDFQCNQSWILQQGDMLYLPPRIPHQGISLSDDCITISFGFRSPSYISMISAFSEQICQTIKQDDFYEDLNLQISISPSYVPDDTINEVKTKLKSIILKVIDDSSVFRSWFGSYVSNPLRMRLRRPYPFFLQDAIQTEEVEGYEEEYYPPKDSSKQQFINFNELIQAVLDKRILLRRYGGIKVINIANDNLFVDGEVSFHIFRVNIYFI